LPEPGTKILAGEKEAEKEVGEITSRAILPLLGGDRAVALGYLRREAAGKQLRVGTATVKPLALPII
jgi:glycine cleavage system aminomethyltransferase T